MGHVPDGAAEILATTRRELRERKPIDITHYLRVRTKGEFTQELLYKPEYVLLTAYELKSILDSLDAFDPSGIYTNAAPPKE